MSDPTTTTSAQIEHDQASGQPLYISPTLKNLDAKHRPEPSPACETCPASVWFSTDEADGTVFFASLPLVPAQA